MKALKGKTNNSVPQSHYLGQEKGSDGNNYHILIMDLFGYNILQLFKKCDKNFDLETILNIGL